MALASLTAQSQRRRKMEVPVATIRSLNAELFSIDSTVTLIRAARMAGFQGQIAPEHLVLALMKPAESRIRKALSLFEIEPSQIEQVAHGRLNQDLVPAAGTTHLASATEHAIKSALDYAGSFRRDVCDDIHLFMGILDLSAGTIAGD